jgi:type 1 fimbria pilin
MAALNGHGEWLAGTMFGFALAILSLPCATWAADGTIHFSGAIVEPPFQIATTSVSRVRSTEKIQAISESSTTSIRFTHAPEEQGGADVALRVVEGAVAAHFVDAAERTSPENPHGNYRLGAKGGTLSLDRESSKSRFEETAVIVMLSYD